MDKNKWIEEKVKEGIKFWQNGSVPDVESFLRQSLEETWWRGEKHEKKTFSDKARKIIFGK